MKLKVIQMIYDEKTYTIGEVVSQSTLQLEFASSYF